MANEERHQLKDSSPPLKCCNMDVIKIDMTQSNHHSGLGCRLAERGAAAGRMILVRHAL